ncbi:MAG: efflux transporter periplasmic adaptor subunit [Ponticaulis sp.]|nr:efflux transporter periplasmic adaptor subunit [Ponticaulis sp.]
MMDATKSLTVAALLAIIPVASAQDLVIEETIIQDYRPVVARVEASDTATARSRLQGVVTSLRVDEGDVTESGQVIAVVTDDTIGPQLAALSARISGIEQQIAQSEQDVARNEALFNDGFFPKARLDEQKTGLNVLKQNLASAVAERRALSARQSEGNIRAPADARVTSVSVVEGSIVSPGEVIARFATLDGIVRLTLPERHAGQIAESETITLRLPARDNQLLSATIVKIYPELRNGELVADASVSGTIDALVGERVDVLAPVGERRALLIPEDYVDTRYGVDFIRVQVGDRFIDAPVTLASTLANEDGQYEVLSGLKIGDRIQKPE